MREGDKEGRRGSEAAGVKRQRGPFLERYRNCAHAGEKECAQNKTPARSDLLFNDPFISSPPLRLLLQLIGMKGKKKQRGKGKKKKAGAECFYLPRLHKRRSSDAASARYRPSRRWPCRETGRAAAAQIQHSAARYISTRRK